MEAALKLSSDFQILKNETVGKTFKQEKQKLLEFIKKRVSNKADAEDILQDVFYQFVESFNILTPIEHVTAWLFKVARNKIIDRYRKHKPVLLDTLQSVEIENNTSYTLIDLLYSPEDNPEEVYVRSIIWEEFAAALEKLPAEQKDVFVFHELEGKSFKEISESTGVAVNTLLSRKRYAVISLRKKLETVYKELINNIHI